MHVNFTKAVIEILSPIISQVYVVDFDCKCSHIFVNTTSISHAIHCNHTQHMSGIQWNLLQFLYRFYIETIL